MTTGSAVAAAPRVSPLRVSVLFAALALLCLCFADIAVTTVDPWLEMARVLRGFAAPDVAILDQAGEALLRTLAFAFTGVTLASLGGFMLTLVWHWRLVRIGCAFVRSIHELFWALIFLQFFGLHPLTGVLAIALPYSGVFAKVYAEILEETSGSPARALPSAAPRLSALVYSRVAQAWPHLVSYTSYRLECGLRSSAILGFVGLPTLGYFLEASFSQGYYAEVATLLLLFYALVASLRLWCRPVLVPLYILAAPFLLGEGLPIVWGNVARFFGTDIVPSPWRHAETLWALPVWGDTFSWLAAIVQQQALPGLWNTLVLTQIALLATALLTLLLYPLVSRHFLRPKGRACGHLLLVIVRSTPEYLLAYMLLQLWGPSMLPAIVALALHNGSLIGYLVGRRSNAIMLRADAASGLNRYGYELLPRLYSPFLALLFYRWEVMLRETAILGILGLHTLGFFVDSAIQEIRFDVALVLILVTAALNILVDWFARRLRQRLQLKHAVSCDYA